MDRAGDALNWKTLDCIWVLPIGYILFLLGVTEIGDKSLELKTMYANVQNYSYIAGR